MKHGRLLGVMSILIVAAAVLYWSSERGPGAGRSGEGKEPSSTGLGVGATPISERVAAVRYDANGVAIGGLEPHPRGGIPLDIDNIIANYDKAVIVSRDGADTFTVPRPGDPRWPDYLEFRRTFRSSLDNTPGFVTPYDPHWRTQLTGVRPAEDPDFELFGGAASLRDLLQMVLDAVGQSDEYGLADLAIRKEEFEIICWPAFPQSRPYLRYTVEESWGFHYAGIFGGIKEGVRVAGDRALDLSSVAYDEIKDYGNFEIYRNVKIGATDRETGERLELRFVRSVIERNGVFKVFIYTD